MDDLVKALSKYFKMPRGMDNLPVVAMPRTGRDTGRHQLAKAMYDFGCRSGIEIGVGGGKSAQMWCEAIPGLQLIGIDSYPGRASRHFSKAQKRAEQCGFQLLRISSMEAVDKFEDESVDFVHIDGDHTFDFVMLDIIRWTPKVKKGGLVLCHDYCSLNSGGVVKAVDAYVHCHRIDPWYVTRDCNPVAFWQRGIERA